MMINDSNITINVKDMDGILFNPNGEVGYLILKNEYLIFSLNRFSFPILKTTSSGKK